MWAVYIGELFEEPKVFPLVEDSRPLDLLVQVIKKYNPEHEVVVDSNITRNPFVSKRLFAAKYFHHEPDLTRMQNSLDHPEVKECERCGHEAWYNSYGNYYPHVGWWECTNSRCEARQHSDGSWYKLTKEGVR